MKKAVYAGSFSVLTNGHLWAIEEAASLFDEVVVAVGFNPKKDGNPSTETRLKILRETTSHFPNVSVTSFSREYLVRYAASIGAHIVIRGIRDAKDFEYERVMRHINADMNPNVKTVFLIPPRELAEISSSTVKNMVGPEGWENVVSRVVPEPVLKWLISSHHHIWQNLIKAGASGNEELFWKEILLPYFGKDRFYHSWRHIMSILSDFELVKNELRNPLAVEFSLWTHDFVYDPIRKNNEEKSAEFAISMLERLGLPHTLKEEVSRMIMATIHDGTEEHDSDTKYLLDLDLSILGKPKEDFDKYEEGVREEYRGTVPYDKDFARGRAHFLRTRLLNRKSIYYTEFFRAKYEKSARENLARSLKRLDSMI